MAVGRAALQRFLPERFATCWLDLHSPSDWTNNGLTELERQVHEWKLTPTETEGYEKAEVKRAVCIRMNYQVKPWKAGK